MDIIRKPIITRVPIRTTGEVYKTLASNNDNYTNPTIMGVYPDLATARQNYQKDMDNYKNEGGGGTHFAILRVVQKGEDNATG